MKTNKKLVLAFVGMLIVLGCGGLLWADPPDRVGRINLLTGTVSFRPGSMEDWVPATLNYPLTAGDHLWADQDGQAEIHVGSTAIRLASNTEFSLLNLDDQTMQIRLSTGSLNIRLRRLDPNEVVEVDTPNSSITLTQPGSYRVDVQETGDSSLTVRSGEAEVMAGDSSFSVYPDQAADISGLDSPSYEASMAGEPDEWDQWCQDRDRGEDRMASTQYVPREMIGVEDLDANGVWRVMPGYGAVWQPTVEVGWAPYRYGHWAWVDPWGWTWIDDAPWGFAPFHYGRWTFFGGAWVWVPGRIVVRPIYAPALVVFVGGNGWGSSMGSAGGVAWFPLGPREPYVPPYAVSNVYVRNINISHVTVMNAQTINVTTYRWVNRSVPGAVVAVPNRAFVGAQPVNSSAFAVSNAEIMRAPVRGTYAPVAPVRESVYGRPVMGPAAQPPAMIMSRPVVARVAPPPAPVPFAARQQAMQAHPGRPVDQTTLQGLRRTSPGQSPPVVVNPAARSQGGPQRIQGGQGPQPGNPQGPRVVSPGSGAGQPGPRVQPGPQGSRGSQAGTPPGPQGPRGPQGQGPRVQPGGPGGQPGPSNDDILKKKRPEQGGEQGPQGGQGPQGEPGPQGGQRPQGGPGGN